MAQTGGRARTKGTAQSKAFTHGEAEPRLTSGGKAGNDTRVKSLFVPGYRLKLSITGEAEPRLTSGGKAGTVRASNHFSYQAICSCKLLLM